MKELKILQDYVNTLFRNYEKTYDRSILVIAPISSRSEVQLSIVGDLPELSDSKSIKWFRDSGYINLKRCDQ